MHNKFMEAALAEAQKAKECGEVPVGAVVVKDGEVIARAHNLCETHKNPMLHAEVVAIEKALNTLGCMRLENCDLYVTLEPCVMCCGAISNSRIRRLYFGAYDKIAGGVVSKFRLFDKPSPLGTEYYCGIMENECSKILTDFFRSLR